MSAMRFLELLTLAAALLQREKRISCRALSRIFELDDACLEDLKFELVHAKRLAVEQDGGVLVWAEHPEIIVHSPLLASTAAEEAQLLPSAAERVLRRSSNVRSWADRQPQPRRLKVNADS